LLALERLLNREQMGNIDQSSVSQDQPAVAEAFAVLVEGSADIPLASAVIAPPAPVPASAGSGAVIASCEQPNSVRSTADETALRTFLTANQWPIGLQDTFLRNLEKIPFRFFICDDSGSMTTSDGHRIVTMSSDSYQGKKKYVSCSRWQELTAALKFHAEAARLACAPTEFRLLNGGPPIVIGDKAIDSANKYQRLINLFDSSPNGGTPLCYHIREVVNKIATMAPSLRANGQKVCVIIATDGESSDGDIATAMRPLKDLPCWVVVRLCTDQDRIVSYWNNIDSELELDMDVLDDLQGEAKEVTEHNPWLTYGEPLHRIREFGIPVKELDLLDEMKLAPSQLSTFAHVL
jgi:hypothetical protein